MTPGRIRHGLKERAVGGARRLLGAFLYLWVLLTIFSLHESVVLAKHDIAFSGYGLALFNAWVLAKVMLIVDDLELGGHWFDQRALIWGIVRKAGLLALVLIGAYTVERLLVGLWKGNTVLESLPRIGGGSLADFLSVGVILFVALMPFFAFKRIDRALGRGTLRSLLLARRSEIGSRTSSGKQDLS